MVGIESLFRGFCMGVVPRRKFRFTLGMMRGVGMDILHGVVLVLFMVTFFVQACL
jgi:hypothetical protein